MLHDHQAHSGADGSRPQGADLLTPRSPTAVSDALMHLSDVVMREMFAVTASRSTVPRFPFFRLPPRFSSRRPGTAPTS